MKNGFLALVLGFLIVAGQLVATDLTQCDCSNSVATAASNACTDKCAKRDIASVSNVSSCLSARCVYKSDDSCSPDPCCRMIEGVGCIKK